jgi:hypothetical protein
MHRLTKKKKFIWISEHTNIEGNEKVNTGPKKVAHKKDHIQLLKILTYADIKTQIKKVILLKWQSHQLNQQIKLREIKQFIK